MKKFMLFIALGAIASNVFATKILVVNRTKINGDGSGNYRDISRSSESGTNAAGDEVVTVSIGCGEPGPNACPMGKPASGGDDGDPKDGAVLNYIDTRMAEIDHLIEQNVVVGSDSRVVAIQQANGQYIKYIITESWDCSTASGTMSISAEEIE